MPATDQGAANELITAPITDDQAEDVFLKRFLPPDADDSHQDKEGEKTPKQDAEGEESDDASQEEEDTNSAEDQLEDGDEEAEGEETDDKSKHKDADDDAYVKIKVGDEEHEVPVKDLKRLYGQEKSLTQKSMEVAQQRKQIEDGLTKNSTATAALLERAKARFQPYSQIDFMLAAKELPADEYQALKAEAQKAFEDVQFLEKNLDGLIGQIRERQDADLIETAKKSLETLAGPADKGGIEGWNEKVYDDIRNFAVEQGAPVETINKLVDAWAIKLLHDAMLYQRGKSKVITKKVNKTPKKVIKQTITQGAATKSGGDKADAAMKQFRKRGGDDATDVFLARWGAAAEQD